MDEPLNPNFAERVEAYVRLIPPGRVMTYGQLAALAGSPTAARIVGGIAHFGDPDLPWQRVVSKQGGLASGYPGGRTGHRQALEAEGITVSADDRVTVRELLWWPEANEPHTEPRQNSTSKGMRHTKSTQQNQAELL